MSITGTGVAVVQAHPPLVSNETGFIKSLRNKTSTTFKGFSDTFRRSARGLFRSPERAHDTTTEPSTPADDSRHGRRGSIFSLFSTPSPTKPTPVSTSVQRRNPLRRSSRLDRLSKVNKKHKSQPDLRSDNRLSRKRSLKPSTWSLDRLRSMRRPDLSAEPDAQIISNEMSSEDNDLVQWDRISHNAPQVNDPIPSHKLDNLSYRESTDIPLPPLSGEAVSAGELAPFDIPLPPSDEWLAMSEHYRQKALPSGILCCESPDCYFKTFSPIGLGSSVESSANSEMAKMLEELRSFRETTNTMESNRSPAPATSRDDEFAPTDHLKIVIRVGDELFSTTDLIMQEAERMSSVDLDTLPAQTTRSKAVDIPNTSCEPRWINNDPETAIELVRPPLDLVAQSYQAGIGQLSPEEEITLGCTERKAWLDAEVDRMLAARRAARDELHNEFTGVNGTPPCCATARRPSDGNMTVWPQSLPESGSEFFDEHMAELSAQKRFVECPAPMSSERENDSTAQPGASLTPRHFSFELDTEEAKQSKTSDNSMAEETPDLSRFTSASDSGYICTTEDQAKWKQSPTEKELPRHPLTNQLPSRPRKPHCEDTSGVIPLIACPDARFSYQEPLPTSERPPVSSESMRAQEPARLISQQLDIHDEATPGGSMVTPFSCAVSTSNTDSYFALPRPSHHRHKVVTETSNKTPAVQGSHEGKMTRDPAGARVLSSSSIKTQYVDRDSTQTPETIEISLESRKVTPDMTRERSDPTAGSFVESPKEFTETRSKSTASSPSKLPKFSPAGKGTPPSRIATPVSRSGNLRTDSSSIGSKQGKRVGPERTPTPSPYAQRKSSIPALSPGNKYYSKKPSLTQHRHNDCVPAKDETEDTAICDWTPRRTSPLSKQQSRHSLKSSIGKKASVGRR